MPITRDDWLAAVKEAEQQEPPPSDALTMAEFCDLVGLSRSGATARMDRLLTSGKAARTTKVIKMGNGAFRSVPAFRLTEG